MRRTIWLIAIVGCAPAAGPGLPAPGDIPRLEAAAVEDAGDTDTRITLAVAYREAGRAGEAVSILEEVVAANPADAGAVLLLGLTREDVADWEGAHDAYTRYLGLGRSAALKQTISRRLAFVRRSQLEAEVSAAVERERELTSLPADPATVGVFPFRYQGTDATLQPLGRALAELLVTQLGAVDRLTVLERLRVQLLLDEIRLGESERVDPATAARSGRMLRAGRIVQGSIDGGATQIRLDARVVATDADAPVAGDPVTEQDPLDRFFDMQERLALGLFNSLGIQLTVAERERVLSRPTENLQALLAFGRGLEAEDRGDYRTAARYYREAATLDPQFTEAGGRSTEVDAIADAGETNFETMVETAIGDEDVRLAGPAPGQAGPTLPPGGLGVPTSPVWPADPIGGGLPDPLPRDPGPEGIGNEGIGLSTILRLIFRRPGS